MTEQARILSIELAAAAGLGLLFALLGPFGTYVLGGLVERLVYWIGLMLVAFLIYRPAWRAALRWAEERRLPLVATAAAAILLASLPMTLIVWLASYRHTPSLWPSLAGYFDLLGSVLVVGTILVSGFWIIERGASSPVGDRIGADAPAPPSFMDRLPHGIRGELLALQMEDHYVRAHTDRGQALILMRLRDAMAELAGVAGAQVHRSWWVARSAIAEVRRDGRDVRLKLTNGTLVPVSRDRLPELRKSRFLGGR